MLAIHFALAWLVFPDLFPLKMPPQSVYSREVEEEEVEVEGALRERDERIRELEMVILKQVEI